MIFNLRSLLYLRLLSFFSLLRIQTRNWIDIWILLELLNLTFLPIIFFFEKKINRRLLLFKFYRFITISSYLILASFLWRNRELFPYLFLIIIIVKLNISPFYLWFVNIFLNFDFKRFIYIRTVNKVPIFVSIIMTNRLRLHKIKVFYIISLLIPTLQTINEVNIFTIIFLSSRYHSTWMVISLTLKLFRVWLFYFLIYRALVFILINLFHKLSINNLSDIKKNSDYHVVTILLLFLTFIGIPPTCGFFTKALVIVNILYINRMIFIALVMIITSSLWVFTYLMVRVKNFFFFTSLYGNKQLFKSSLLVSGLIRLSLLTV